MARYQAPWQCSKKVCSSIRQNCSKKPSISLLSPLNENGQAYIQIQDKQFKALFDSGASVSCISEHIVNKLLKNPEICASTLSHVYGVCGEIHSVLGTINLSFTIDGFPFSHTFHVFTRLHTSFIIGRDFMKKAGLSLDFSSNSIVLKRKHSESFSVSFISDVQTKTCLARTLISHVIPPHSEYTLSLKVNKFQNGDIVLCEPPKHLAKDELAGGKCLSVVSDGNVLYRLMNPSSVPVFLKKNSTVSILSEVNISSIKHVTDSNVDQSEFSPSINFIGNSQLSDDQYIEIAQNLGINLDDSDLTAAQKHKLLVFIGRNRKTFAKDFSELGVTNLHYHRIETGDHKPIKKAPYRQSPAMKRETERQVQEMLENGIII